MILTSIHISFYIFHTFYTRMITICYQGLNRVQQTVNVRDASRIPYTLLQSSQASPPVLVTHRIHLSSQEFGLQEFALTMYCFCFIKDYWNARLSAALTRLRCNCDAPYFLNKQDYKIINIYAHIYMHYICVYNFIFISLFIIYTCIYVHIYIYMHI